MGEERRLTVPGVLEEVTRVCNFVVEAAEAAGLDERAVYHCQMAVDEWCTNIVEHGYHNNGSNSRIEVDCQADAERLRITIIDDSPPFDPTMLAEPRTNQALEDREPGGLGWLLIKKVMDEVDYDYSDHHNRLMMTKNITPEMVSVRASEVSFPSHELRGHIWIVAPYGRLDSNTGPLLERTLLAHLNEKHFNLIVDMGKVTYISSGGLKVLLSAHRKLQNKNGLIVLVDLKPRVSEVVEMLGFNQLFKIATTVHEATSWFQHAGTG